MQFQLQMDFKETLQKMHKHRKDNFLNRVTMYLGAFVLEFTLMAYLAFPLQLSSEPLKVAVPPLHARLLQLKDG